VITPIKISGNYIHEEEGKYIITVTASTDTECLPPTYPTANSLPQKFFRAFRLLDRYTPFSEMVENHCCRSKKNVTTTTSYFLVRMIKPGL